MHKACGYKRTAASSFQQHDSGGLSASKDAAPLPCTQYKADHKSWQGLMKGLSSSLCAHGRHRHIVASTTPVHYGISNRSRVLLVHIIRLTSACHTCNLLCAWCVSSEGQGQEKWNHVLGSCSTRRALQKKAVYSLSRICGVIRSCCGGGDPAGTGALRVRAPASRWRPMAHPAQSCMSSQG